MKVRAVFMPCLFALLFNMALTNIAFASDLSPAKKEITVYPFAASPQRAAGIKNNYKRVTAGMAPSDVKAILGEPDEILPLWEPVVKNGKQIGHTYWYVIKRVQKIGSVNEKQEALVHVSFNLNAQVTKVDAWGFEDGK